MITKTTIVATIGPATASEEMIKALMYRRVTVFRLNFSHGTLESHQSMLDTIRKVAQIVPWSVCVMGDLCGPKIRAADITEPEILQIGDEVVILANNQSGSAHCFGITTPELISDIQIGERILIDDGSICLVVEGKEVERLICRVRVGGKMSSGKGINLPDSRLNLPPITERDWECVDWAVKNQLDYLALSFVQTADEIMVLRRKLNEYKSPIKIVAKIEKPLALTNIESILCAADALLVARGDMGVEMDLAQVSLAQKKMTALCHNSDKPIIVATQVLQSMIKSPVPTRAEASDVSNAVMDYADAVMLSGETAVGEWPIQAVDFLAHACSVTEQHLDKSDAPRQIVEVPPELKECEAVLRSLVTMIDHIKTKIIVVWTESGVTARMLSKMRPDVPILALCPDPRVARQLSFFYGVLSVCSERPIDLKSWLEQVENLCLQNGWAIKGDSALLTLPRNLLSPQNRWVVMMHDFLK